MNHLFKPIFKSLLKQKSTLLLLGIALVPLLVIITSLFNTEFMQLGGADGSVSALDFIGAMVWTQHQFVFPLIILAYMATTLFYDEIQSGRLILFKDLARNKVLSAKRLSILTVFTIYFLLICITSTITYYLYVNQLNIASNTFLPATSEELQYVILELIGFFATELICLSLALTVSILLTSGYTILVTIFYLLMSMIAPDLAIIRFFFPTGYKTMAQTNSFGLLLVGIVFVTGICLVVNRLIARRMYSRLEF